MEDHHTGERLGHRGWKLHLMIEQFVSRGFALRDAAHLAHWASRSYAEHVTLGEFYDALVDGIDTVVETYQGCFGLIGEVIPTSYKKDDILAQIVKEANWIAENRDQIAKGNEVLENKLDELGALYASTVYKLRFLK